MKPILGEFLVFLGCKHRLFYPILDRSWDRLYHFPKHSCNMGATSNVSCDVDPFLNQYGL